MFPVTAPVPVFSGLDGAPLEAGFLYFGTVNQNPQTSPIVVYWDLAGTQPAAQPIRTIGGFPSRNGKAAIIYANSDFAISVYDRNGNLVLTEPSISNLLSFFSASSGASAIGFLGASSAAVPRTMQDKGREIVSAFDNGVVPNSPAAAAANWAALIKLVATAANGGDPAFQFTGTLLFPPVATGRATIYVAGILPFRDGMRVDLGGNIIYFTKAESTLENAAGFIFARRDFTLENGYMVVDYTSTLYNRGVGIQLNARYADTDQAPGNYFLNNFEEDQAPPINATAITPFAWYTITTVGSTDYTLIGSPDNNVGTSFFAKAVGTGTGTVNAFMPNMPGNITLRNLRITHNNPKAAAIQMLGGLKGVVMENIWIDGQNKGRNGIDYEFGGATDEVLNQDEKTSHLTNLSVRNVHIANFDDGLGYNVGIDGTGFSLRGAYNVSVDGLYIKNVKKGVIIGLGEQAAYNPGTFDIGGQKFNHTYRNIVAQDVAFTGIGVTGLYSGGGFYAPVLTAQTLANAESYWTDLLTILFENFALRGPSNLTNGGYGVSVNGARVVLRNGQVLRFSEGIHDTGCRNLTVENVDLLDNFNFGLRINNSGNIYVSGWTDKRVYVSRCKIAGNGTAGAGSGILFETGSCNALIEFNNFGHNNRATGQFTWGGGGAGKELTSLKVNDVEILAGPGTPVVWDVSDVNTTQLILTAINSYAATSGYSATFEGNTILIRAASGTGTTPNGYVLLPTGTLTFSGIMNMSGGKYETGQAYSVYVSADETAVKAKRLVVVRNNQTLAALTAAYCDQDGSSNNCILDRNSNLNSRVGNWEVDGCAQDNGTNMNNKAHNLNVRDKYYGRKCYNTSTNKLFVALGPAATDPWKSVDGVTTITPA